MFGGLSFIVDERMAVAAGRTGDLLVRTDPAQYDDLLQRGGLPAHMGNQRPMGRGWLSVPSRQIHDDAELAFWLEVGINSRTASS
ncbi:MAG: TfoX/Sxy family protein [Trueperaceae bacterium]|nr:TfoX/Sxy family protein [Trueperaceae bacterium]